MASVQTAPIRLSKSVVGEQELAAVRRVIERGFLGMGQEVKEFEEELAAFIGGDRHVVCVNTGTSALHLSIQACGIGPGDEVIVPTLTFVASFQAVSATGATPVACDVDADTGCIDPDDARRLINGRTRAIMPVHYASGRGRIDEVYALARERGLRVIEDAAHAFGCQHDGGMVGATGDIVCFSFDGIKNITSGEGGAIVTSDGAVASAARDARLLGVERDTDKRFAGQRSWEFDVTQQGWRYHMSDLMAAIGRAQLERFPEFAAARVALARRYRELLTGVAGLRLLRLPYGAVVPHIFVAFVEGGQRDVVREALLREGIECGIHYKPNHLLSRFGSDSVRLPVAERLYDEMLTLPLHPDLSFEQQDCVVDVLARALAGA